jgi:hypothetical protein
VVSFASVLDRSQPFAHRGGERGGPGDAPGRRGSDDLLSGRVSGPKRAPPEGFSRSSTAPIGRPVAPGNDRDSACGRLPKLRMRRDSHDLLDTSIVTAIGLVFQRAQHVALRIVEVSKVAPTRVCGFTEPVAGWPV